MIKTISFNKIGRGIVRCDKVRVYHRLGGRLLPAKVRLDWNDDDAIPFVYYNDLKGKIQFGTSEERFSDLYNKMEKSRFEYPRVLLSGRLWTKRRIIVFDQFHDGNKGLKFIYLHEFSTIVKHYVEDFNEYKLVFHKTESGDDVYMSPIIEVYEKCMNDIIRKEMSLHSSVRGRKRKFTGLSAIDHVIGELKKSELVVIAGRSTMGKTSLLVSITMNLLPFVPIAYFSLGMSAMELGYRLLSNIYRLRVETIEDGCFSIEEWGEQHDILKDLFTSHLYVDDSPELMLEELESKIRKMVEAHSVEIVMIDYLQLINSNANSHEENLERCLERMRELAKRLDIAVVVVNNLFQEKRTLLQFPKLAHHREMKIISQYADWTFYIYRPDAYRWFMRRNRQDDNSVSTGHVEITNHHTKKSDLVILAYDKKCMRFNDLR